MQYKVQLLIRHNAPCMHALKGCMLYSCHFHEYKCIYKSCFSFFSFSICLPNLSHSRLFLSFFLWWSCCTTCSGFPCSHHILLYTWHLLPRCGSPFLYCVFSCKWHLYDTRIMTTQWGAFQVHKVFFVHVTFIKCSHQLLTSAGLPQDHPNYICYVINTRPQLKIVKYVRM